MRLILWSNMIHTDRRIPRFSKTSKFQNKNRLRASKKDWRSTNKWRIQGRQTKCSWEYTNSNSATERNWPSTKDQVASHSRAQYFMKIQLIYKVIESMVSIIFHLDHRLKIKNHTSIEGLIQYSLIQFTFKRREALINTTFLTKKRGIWIKRISRSNRTAASSWNNSPRHREMWMNFRT